jgi:hypothetical protein
MNEVSVRVDTELKYVQKSGIYFNMCAANGNLFPLKCQNEHGELNCVPRDVTVTGLVYAMISRRNHSSNDTDVLISMKLIGESQEQNLIYITDIFAKYYHNIERRAAVEIIEETTHLHLDHIILLTSPKDKLSSIHRTQNRRLIFP